MRTLHLLFTLREGQSENLLEARLASEGQRLLSSFPAEARTQRRSVRLPDDPFGATEHGQNVEPGFDAAIEMTLEGDIDPELLVKAASGIGERLDPWIDRERSAAMVGTRHVIVPGSGGVLLLYALRRLPELSHAAFSDYWLNHHAELGRAVPGLKGYAQVHADLDANRAAADAAGLGVSDLDGIAEGQYADAADFLAVMSQPEVTADALEDERRFIDLTRTRAMLGRVAYEVGPRN